MLITCKREMQTARLKHDQWVVKLALTTTNKVRGGDQIVMGVVSQGMVLFIAQLYFTFETLLDLFLILLIFVWSI